MATLIGGFWLSTWGVFRDHGDRRSALNLAMEWSAIGAAWWVTRKLVRNADGRQWIVPLLISLSLGAAIVGICQHHVTSPRISEWYRQQRARMDTATGTAGVRAAVDGASAARDFRRREIPTAGPARELFERRLLDSSEPTGPFALANTFGGLLAVVLVLLIGGVSDNVRDHVRMNWLTWAVIAITFFVVGYCLLLTKSRTAWSGLAIGTAYLTIRKRSMVSDFRLKRLIVGGLLLLTAGTAIGIGTGAIDKEVVLESPRSLQFRLFYWMGAAGVIADRPLLGSGPGNFRQCYLPHKVVESSEEILDPHNILLDAWCSAGILGFAAICVIAISSLAFDHGAVSDAALVSHPSRVSPARAVSRTVLFGIVSGLVVHVLWRWFNGGDLFDLESQDLFDSDNLVLLIPFAGIICFSVLRGRLRFSGLSARAAFACLCLHLLGAGGLQIVVLGLLLLLLNALSGDDEVPAGDMDARTATNRNGWMLAVGLALACGAVLWLGVIPVVTAARHTSFAAVLSQQGRSDAAVAACDAGIVADSWGTDSRQRKMEILAYQFVEAAWRCANSERRLADFLEIAHQRYDQALDACNQVIAADARSLTGYYFRSRLSVQLNDLQPAEMLRANAVKDMQHVMECYPGNSAFWYEYADLLFRFGLKDEARAAAVRALEIDRINHDWGHLDRYLHSDQVTGLREIADSK